MIYDKLYNGEKNWIVAVDKYEQDFIKKTESIFMIGNGYLGIRAANEESSVKTTRNTFISGTFNLASSKEVTELPNIGDIFKLDLIVNDKLLLICDENVVEYDYWLNLKTGELNRIIIVRVDDELILKLEFSRFASLYNLHLVASNIKISASIDCSIEFNSGIDASVSNSGSQHFYEGNKRLFNNNILFQSITTTQSNIEVGIGLGHVFNSEVDSLIMMERRMIFNRYRKQLKANDVFEMTKYGVFATSIDSEGFKSIQEFVVDSVELESKNSYEYLLNQSKLEWNKYWNETDIEIDGDDFTNLSVRYAMFQLRGNAPIHDERMNIGAKGLSGEGYKGHTFWDTEIFMLPYFIFTNPQAARSLLKYRYLGLVGARKKAQENGYEGAMYPWESAWPTDGEVTPIWGAADIITGLPTKILSGFIEQHISADVIYGVYLYYNVTNDYEFMEKYGYEMIMETAKFWSSRAQWNEVKNQYEILNVVGPDEYKEEVDNNAFTNIMAKWNIDLAISYINKYGNDKFSKVISSDDYKQLINVSSKIYAPSPNDNLIIPQDDTYLELEEIDLSTYKNAKNVGLMFEDYSLEQVNRIQVSKQADVLLLFLLFPQMYNDEIIKKNFDFYEQRTLHDSSLSLSTHVILANRFEYDNIVDDLFERSCKIDIGENMKSSDAGIHMASLGGIWQGVVFGFAGVYIINNQLHISPRIKSTWNEIKFNLVYQGNKLNIVISKGNKFIVTNYGDKAIKFNNNNKTYEVLPKEKIYVNKENL